MGWALKSGLYLLLNTGPIRVEEEADFAAGHVFFTGLGQQGAPQIGSWEQAEHDGLAKVTSKLILEYYALHKNSNCAPYLKMVKYVVSIIENASHKRKRGVKYRKSCINICVINSLTSKLC